MSLDLRNCDCMDLMKEFPDKYFDLAIVDPPYGIKETGERSNRIKPGGRYLSANPNKKRYLIKDWDNESPNQDYFKELFRVSKNQIIWGANHFISKMPLDSSCWLVWYKAGQTGGTDFADCELAWTSLKKAIRYFKYDWTGFGHINAKEERTHPTQKPMALYKWILKNYANIGDRILDSHLGSMSSVIACLDMGYDITGSEIDKDYFEAGMKRVRQYQSQLKIFQP